MDTFRKNWYCIQIKEIKKTCSSLFRLLRPSNLLQSLLSLNVAWCSKVGEGERAQSVDCFSSPFFKFRDHFLLWSQQTGLLNTDFSRFKVHIERKKSIQNIAMLMRMKHERKTDKGRLMKHGNRSGWECCIAGFHLKQCHHQKDTQEWDRPNYCTGSDSTVCSQDTP